MATYHCKLNKGKGSYGLQHANYILREGKYSAERSGREDLLYKEYGNLPEWADSPQEFWKAAGLYERANAVKYYELEIALPNELPKEENIKIVQDYVKKVIGEKPYTFAIHDKPAALDEEVRQPHAHIMFSERAAEKDVHYTKEQYFKRYNSRHPERGGARKDNRFIVYGTEIMYQIRKDLENIINESYERNGLDNRVSSATLKEIYQDAVAKNNEELARYYDREPEQHLGPVEVQKIKKDTENIKTKKEKENYYREFASDAALGVFLVRQYKELAQELTKLEKERAELQRQREKLENEIAKEIGKAEELSEKPVVRFVAEDALKIVNEYIKILTDEEKRVHTEENNTSKFILSERRMIMIAQSVYTNGESREAGKEFNNIKRIEKKYNEEYAAWVNAKPAGLNPVERYRYFEKEAYFEKWKSDIDKMKAENQAKIDTLKERISQPEIQEKIKSMVNVMKEKNNIRQERCNNFKEYRNQLNNQISLCYAIRSKLRDNIYEKEHQLTMPEKIYQSIKTGDIAQAQNVINELRSSVNKLETNRAQGMFNSHFLSRSYDEEKGRGGFER